MDSSILTSTKKLLGLDESYTAFDTDVIVHINTVFSILADLGIGPSQGFSISDASTTWGEFLGTNPLLNSVKTYVFLRVKMLFDPPSTSFVRDAMNEQIRELEWRLNVQRESVAWVDSNPVDLEPDPIDEIVIIDGGTF